MAKNIELKLEVKNLDALETLSRALATEPEPQLLNQVDIYYRVKTGRLKLRIINGKRAELIAYQRADEGKARASNYFIKYISNVTLCNRRLAQQFGIRTVVQKKRLVYFYQNTRIHLDKVAGLGTFVEFEYVVGPRFPEEKGAVTLDFLMKKLKMEDAKVCRASYVDLMEEALLART